MENIDSLVYMIQMTGVRLILSQETIAAAIVYFNKFKQFGPYSSFTPVESGSACLFLACKVADETRKIRDILNCWKETEGGSFDKELTKEYYHLKERIVECEQVILRTFVFDVETAHPSLKVSIEVVQCGWSILLDSYMFHIREEYDPMIITIASLYVAIRMLQYIVSSEVISTKEWWNIFEISTHDLSQCSGDLLSMYE